MEEQNLEESSENIGNNKEEEDKLNITENNNDDAVNNQEQTTNSETLETENIVDEQTAIYDDKTLKGEELEDFSETIETFGDENKQEEAEVSKDKEDETKTENKTEVEAEEDVFVEEPPPDPAAPYNLSDSNEALKEPFDLREDQLAEVEQLWEFYQNYTPAYAELDGYITEKELVYMLKSLLLMTYTAEQLQELIDYCVKPVDPDGHITFDQFLKIVTIRQRDTSIEEELRSALQAFDPNRTGTIDREYLKEVLSKQGNKLAPKLLDNFIKEVDLSNDGTIGIEDVIGTMCIDLNKDDILMLKAALNPVQENPEDEAGL